MFFNMGGLINQYDNETTLAMQVPNSYEEVKHSR